MLAPTTLLAEQHFQSASATASASWPVKVAELSRFRSPKEVKAALVEGIEDGTVDIVIGTHKLLSARASSSSAWAS